MTKQNLFVPEVKNHVSRNAFDLSQRKIFSQKLGEILPILVQDCLPGDKFSINCNSFSRTAPLNSAAFARMKQYYNFYFVPYRLLYRDFPSFVVQQSKSSKAATGIRSNFNVPSLLPYTTENVLAQICQSAYATVSGGHDVNQGINTLLLNPVGLNRMTQTRKLMQYLGYYRSTLVDDGNFIGSAITKKANNTRLNLFPLLAYQKVYNDFYRFSQWENEQANTYNVDYMSGSQSMELPVSSLFSVRTGTDGNTHAWYPRDMAPSMFDMRYVNYTKDSFLGVVPTSQFGAVSTVNLADNLEGVYIDAKAGANGKAIGISDSAKGLGPVKDDGKTYDRTAFDIRNYPENSPLNLSFDILTLRAAQAKQKFAEVTLSNKSDYKSQIEAHFNVKVSSLMSNLCDYIGGFSSDLSLNTVVNNNLAGDGSSANYSATANFSGNGNIDFECREHGLIIGVSYILPFIDWTSIGFDFPLTRVEFSDFALPEFDKLGFEELDPRTIIGVQKSTLGSAYTGNTPVDVHLGYGPRFYDYKCNYDVVLGDFNKSQGGSQPNFVLALTPNMHNLCPTSRVLDDYPFNYSMLKNYVSLGYISDAQSGSLNYASFKVSPQIANSIFTVHCGLDDNQSKFRDDCTFDQIYNVCDFNITVIRNLDRLGLPY